MSHYRMQRQTLPLGGATKSHIFSTLFFEFVLLFSAIFAPHEIVPPFLYSSHDFSPLVNSTLLNDSYLCPPLLNSF